MRDYGTLFIGFGSLLMEYPTRFMERWTVLRGYEALLIDYSARMTLLIECKALLRGNEAEMRLF